MDMNGDLWVKINPHKSPFPINPTCPALTLIQMENWENAFFGFPIDLHAIQQLS